MCSAEGCLYHPCWALVRLWLLLFFWMQGYKLILNWIALGEKTPTWKKMVHKQMKICVLTPTIVRDFVFNKHIFKFNKKRQIRIELHTAWREPSFSISGELLGALEVHDLSKQNLSGLAVHNWKGYCSLGISRAHLC